MQETKSIANKSKNSPAALAGKTTSAQHGHEQDPEFNDRLPIQLKLAVGATNDPLEYEADAMADKVMRMPETSFIQRKASCSCGDYDDEHVRLKPLASQVSPYIQAKGNGAGTVSDAVSGRIQSNLGGGSSLQSGTKSFMESRFGTDFSDVKIHNSDESAQLSRSLNAKAFTVNNNIFFNSSQYQPETDSGKHLLAHELTHVVQQSPNKSSGGLVQRFESEEHQFLGDTATGKATYNLGTTDKFELTHGDILALSGDVFMPEDLFKLAAIPGDKGTKVDTRDEILWALQDPRIWEMRAEKGLAKRFAGQKDPRFAPGGAFAGFSFSDAVKNRVFERYQKLGAANAGHFVAPQGRDAKGKPIPAANSSGSNYVKYHEVAIKLADAAGRANTSIDMAMANEAAAQHFLTDSFSAGHLRTPIAAIREYWGKKYPLFWFNLRHKIALDTAIEMTSGTVVTTHYGYTQILEQVEAMAPTLPAVTLGDLIASVYHDFDNEHGLNIKGGGKVFGDKHLDQGDTEKLAIAAIKAGNDDITKAFANGKSVATAVPDPDLFAAIRKISGGVGDKYAAQAMIPEPDKSEPSQNWKAGDVSTLWDQKFLGAKGDTVGQVISRLVQGGPIAIQLRALGDRFPVDAPVVKSPRASYLKGFVDKLQADPKAGVLDIVFWSPHDMWTGSAPREVAAELEAKGKAGDPVENLSNMTFEQRVKFVKGLISDGEPADHEMINSIFKSVDVVQRKKIYAKVEGHAWAGAIQAKDDLSFTMWVKGKKTVDKKGVETQQPDKKVIDKVAVDKLNKIINGK